MTTKEFKKLVGKNASTVAVEAGYSPEYWRVALYRDSKIRKDRLDKMIELSKRYNVPELTT